MIVHVVAMVGKVINAIVPPALCRLAVDSSPIQCVMKGNELV
ncbi:MAG TPA: hypothetical protein O0X23_02115 [Methanocorpusculum sp.]|nr:hypothetical protein [Methanocorpusculum sp.]